MDKTPEQQAEEIVKRLFTNFFKQRADRLVLMSKDGKDLGGWCEAAVRDVIVGVLEEAGNG